MKNAYSFFLSTTKIILNSKKIPQAWIPFIWLKYQINCSIQQQDKEKIML